MGIQKTIMNDDIAMILEEDELINILATSKKTAEEINAKYGDVVTEKKLLEKRVAHYE